MKKLFKHSIAGIFSLLILPALAQEKTEERNPGSFKGIKVGGAYEVYLKQGDSESVKIVAEKEEHIKEVETKVSNGLLVISRIDNDKNDKEAKKDCSGKSVKIYISFKSLESIIVSGASTVKAETQVSAEKLTLKTSGASKLTLSLKADEVSADISGAANVSLSGTAKLINTEVSGAGSLKADELETEKAVANISGAGNAKVFAKATLHAEVSGAGSLVYKGEPGEKDVITNGVGSVRKSKG